jgi:hypothetical protein
MVNAEDPALRRNRLACWRDCARCSRAPRIFTPAGLRAMQFRLRDLHAFMAIRNRVRIDYCVVTVFRRGAGVSEGMLTYRCFSRCASSAD